MSTGIPYKITPLFSADTALQYSSTGQVSTRLLSDSYIFYSFLRILKEPAPTASDITVRGNLFQLPFFLFV